jgi:transposase
MFIEYNQSQTFLLPPDFRQFLGEWHESIILSELIDELDIKSLIQEYHKEWKWRPAFHPGMLLKVLFYGYMNQTFSSRKIASKLHSDLWFMYIAWNNKPDFRTINRFRKEKWWILEDIFIQIVLKAKDLWLVKFWTVSLDWTKIYANASNENNYEIERLDKKIHQLFNEAAIIDEIEDKDYWDSDGSEIPESLKTKEWRDAKRKEIEEKRKQAEWIKSNIEKEIKIKKDQWVNQKRINTTDKDARLMLMKRKDRWTWYNPQNLTENQFILTTIVPNSASDIEELVPILNKFYEKFNCFPENQLADTWYASEKNYQFLQDNNIIWYIPHQKLQINIKDYTFHKINNTFEDKEWNIYKFKQNVWKKKWVKRWRPQQALIEDDIKKVVYVTQLANWKKKFLKINRNWHQLCENNDKRLYSEEWKDIYKKRSWCVEAVFWNIKANFWFERFRLRWFEWVQIERNLISLAHNLKKLIAFQAIA